MGTKFLIIDPATQTPDVRSGSDRLFGVTLSSVFLLLAGYKFWKDHLTAGWVFLAAGSFFLFAAMLFPFRLHPLNCLWLNFGRVLQQIVIRAMMGLLFWLALIPTALAARLCGKKFSPLGFDKDKDSYWIMRQAGVRTAESMKYQF